MSRTLDRLAIALLLAAAAAAGCGQSFTAPGSDVGREPDRIEPIGGGQSGGEGVESCLFTTQPTDTAIIDGKRVVDLLEMFRSALALRPTVLWWPIVREPTPIPRTVLELTQLRFGDETELGCGGFRLPIAFDARTADGQLEAKFEGLLIKAAPDQPSLQLRAMMFKGEFRDGPARAGLEADAKFTLALYWHESEPATLEGTLETGQFTPIAWIGSSALQEWSASAPMPTERSTIAVSDLQRRTCSAVAATSPATFASEAALRAALAKRWVACSGAGPVDADFAGFSIDLQGHWHELRVEADELVAVQGFGHEGQVARNIYGGAFNLALLDRLPERYEFANVQLSANGNTLRLSTQGADGLDIVFQASDAPVRYPQQRAKGMRAGLSACEEREADITSRPESEAALRGLLLGRWLFCRGGLGKNHAGIAFRADGTYRFLEANGSEVQGNGTFTVIDTSSQNGPGAYQVNLFEAPGLGSGALVLPIFSNAPLKLIANDEYQSVLSAF